MSKLSGFMAALRARLPNRDGVKNYEFEIIILKPGVNSHSTHTGKDMTHGHKGPDEKTYELKAENLYRIKPDIITRLKYKLRGINAGFIIPFKSGSEDPISYSVPAFSARVIKTVHESRALSSALKDEFAKELGLKTFFMYFLLMAGAVVVFLVLTGQIAVGG